MELKNDVEDIKDYRKILVVLSNESAVSENRKSWRGNIQTTKLWQRQLANILTEEPIISKEEKMSKQSAVAFFLVWREIG